MGKWVTKIDKIERVSIRVSGGIPGCIETLSDGLIGGRIVCVQSQAVTVA